MKKLFPFILSLTLVQILCAQIKLPDYPDSIFSTYYHQRRTLFQLLPQTKRDIIFIGNSITDGSEWSELFNDIHIKNRGISGDISAGVIKRIDEVAKRNPVKIFLMIGINDLARNIDPDSVVRNILLIATYLEQESPSSKLYVQSILPVNDFYKMFGGHTSKTEQIKQVNEQLKQKTAEYKYTFIDLYSSFCNEEGKLNIELSNDGLHLKGEGYLLWKHLVFPYVYDLQEKPSLLPMPQHIKWDEGYFKLYNCKNILIKSDSLNTIAGQLQNFLSEKGCPAEIKNNISNTKEAIELRIERTDALPVQTEAYKLKVTKQGILISAKSLHGIFNGLQTLKQLVRDGTMVDACDITDWPAFSWRGYMVDVGRNYQSIRQLKQQVDVMASYKLNIFHFHLTEDIAWRLQSKLYPQLTDSKNMLRNPGEYYSLSEMKELIAYCQVRYITLVPEIDMPGHSAAFKRTMGVDMQTDSGIMICKNILRELCYEFDVPFVHIGGDEVKITNQRFLPEMVKLLQSLGKIVIAWDPGGKVPEGTYSQMWNGRTVPKKNFPAIDSRHLYLNHFDPLDGVTATFNHKICDTAAASADKLGATLCNWPDRRVSNEEDVIKMNAVYPIMLTFAERCWRGGGWGNFLSDIGIPGTERNSAFIEFENRLLEHKRLYFKDHFFPYVKQSDIEWKLIGPFKNNGNLSAKFAPETKSFLDTADLNNYHSVFGGTIWLRHFWYPMIQSHLENPQDSTTWYAFRKIWSEEEGIKNFWIGFNNLSRSPATDSPPAGAWDNRESVVWVNGNLIAPPNWKRAGQKGNSEIPLIDEGYEYREPTKIFLNKGGNSILIKAPVGGFNGEWQNPVKWMFTFIRVD